MSTQQELATALRERVAIIQDEQSRKNPEAHMERLRTVSEKIDEIVKRMPDYIDPQLSHFLARRSYSKALEMIERLEKPPPLYKGPSRRGPMG